MRVHLYEPPPVVVVIDRVSTALRPPESVNVYWHAPAASGVIVKGPVPAMAAIVPHVLVVATNIPEYPVSVTVTVCASELPVPKNASNAGPGDGADAGDGVGDAVGAGVAVGVGDATGIDVGISDEVTYGVGVLDEPALQATVPTIASPQPSRMNPRNHGVLVSTTTSSPKRKNALHEHAVRSTGLHTGGGNQDRNHSVFLRAPASLS